MRRYLTSAKIFDLGRINQKWWNIEKVICKQLSSGNHRVTSIVDKNIAASKSNISVVNYPRKGPIFEAIVDHVPSISFARVRVQLFSKSVTKYSTFLRFQHNSAADMADNRYGCDYAKLGTSKCKKCKQGIEKKSPRIAKIVANPFSDDGGDMKQYFHIGCMFETLARARATTKKIEDPGDLEGFQDMEDEEKDVIRKHIRELAAKSSSPKKTPKKTVQAKLTTTGQVISPVKKTPTKTPQKDDTPPPIDDDVVAGPSTSKPQGPQDEMTRRDNSFRQFRRLCVDIADESSYLGKTKLVSTYLKKGNSGDGFKGDVYLLLRLLLPGAVKRVYNINNKQLIKLYSQIFGTSQDEMLTDLEQGDVSETIRKYFDESTRLPPIKKSSLSLQDVNDFLERMATMSKEDEQQRELTRITKRCTANDLKTIIRLIKHDLRMNAGAKHILEALDPNAYEAFQASRNLQDVVDRVLENKRNSAGKPGMQKKLSIRASLMTAVLPMLAEACKSIDQAMKKCPNGMYAEIKYDGERVQVHKQGDQFEYYSRSLKPVLPHKVAHFKDFLPKACPHGNSLILDSEVLLVDNKTGIPLPFGTLGVHKKAAFQDASVCLFVFDCLHFNGENLMDKPVVERKKILRENMKEIQNKIMFTEAQLVTKPSELRDLIMKTFREGLEGLVLKDLKSIYEPGKRHWLKVKKDYLAEGAMADTADLVVLGAFYGTGNKGGIMSVFLMGVYDPVTMKWCTVTKCSSGHDDKTLDQINKDLQVIKISKDIKKVPGWLNVNKSLVPDFIVKDPKQAPVWEITGAEFSHSKTHTADGISIRFPRCTKVRDDKSWNEATDLARLKLLYKKSKETSDMPDMLGGSPRVKGKKAENSSNDVRADSNGDVSSSSPSKMKTPIKRKIEDDDSDDDDEPSPRKRPVCKYSSDCYQTNPKHLEQFDHSPRKAVTKSPGKSSVQSGSKHLPDVFTGMQIYLPNTTPKYEQLKRFVIAYDGDIVADYDKDTASHIVIDGDNKGGRSDKYITADWLWQCVKQKKLVPK
ncbi:DNA ligase 3-like [Glandiceps talaboti]